MTIRRTKTARRRVLGVVIAVVCVVGIGFLVFLRPFRIASGAMAPSLPKSSYIIANFAAYGPTVPYANITLFRARHPMPGDVVVFVVKNTEFVFRVVGTAGDEVSYDNGALSVNGKAVATDAKGSEDIGGVTYRTIPGKTPRMFRTTVPEDHYFLMGDNRDNAPDSRFQGPVARNRIVAKVAHVIAFQRFALPRLL